MTLSSLVVSGIVLCVTQPITILANLLTMIAFNKVPSLQTHTSNLLIFALSITDFICGIYQFIYFGIPSVLGLGPPLGEIGCMVIVVFDNIYATGNFLLVAISIDRVLLVSMDYSKYVKVMTKRHLAVTIGICFLTCQVASVFELSMWNYAKRNNDKAASINFGEACLFPPRRMTWFGTYVTICYFFLPLILVSIFSIIFVKRLVVRLNKIRRIRPEAQDTDEHTTNDDRHELAQNPSAGTSENGPSKKRYIRSAVTLAVLVSAMGISILPYCIYITVVSLVGSYSPTMTNILYFILQLNPLLDPLFFAATQKGIREFYGGKIRSMVRTLGNPN